MQGCNGTDWFHYTLFGFVCKVNKSSCYFSINGCIYWFIGLIFLFSLSDIKPIEKFSHFPTVFPYQPASFSEIQKYCLTHHLLSSVSFIAELTSDVRVDNWSGRFFTQTQQRPKWVVSASNVYRWIPHLISGLSKVIWVWLSDSRLVWVYILQIVQYFTYFLAILWVNCVFCDSPRPKSWVDKIFKYTPDP